MAYGLPTINQLSQQPGGGLDAALEGSNALNMAWLARNKAQLENQFYAPNMQSTIDYRNANTNKINTMLPLEAQNQKNINAFYGPNMQSTIDYRNASTNKLNQMTPLEVEQQKIINKYKAQSLQADINYKNMGGARAGVDQKAYQNLQRQIMMDHPDYDAVRANQVASAVIAGDETLPDGTPVPQLSGLANDQLIKIWGKNAPAAVKNQAANYDVLVNDLKDYDLDAVAAFAGPKGRAKLAYAKAQMAIDPDNPSIDPMARRFIASMNQAIVNMDSMRKAFGTSVVPDYVYQTIGQLSNPNSSIWNDPTQVRQNFKTVMDMMEKNRNAFMAKALHGVGAKAKEVKRVKMFAPNGDKVLLRADQVDQALKTPGWKKRD